MASMDDANHDESEDSVAPSGGGSDFGPPVSEFGPPLDAFGPPTGDKGAVGWQPADGPSVGWQPADGPSVGWQPDDAPPTVPAPPPQYRAPDSTGSRPVVRPPQQYSTGSQETVRGQYTSGSHETVRGQQYTSGSHETVRGPAQQYPTGTHETVRYPDQGGGPKEGDQGTWWQTETTQQSGQAGQQYAQAGTPSSGQRPAPRSLWDDDDLAKKLQAPREPAPATPKGKGSSSGGSLWDDADLANSLAQMTPRSGASSAPVEPRRSRGVLYGGIAAAVVVIVVIIAVVALVLPGKNSKNTAAVTAPPPSGALDCQAFTNATTTIGNGPGDTTSGPKAILGFEHGIYTDRNAEKALSFTVPGRFALTQAIIDQQYPSGVSYCLRITTLAPDTFEVEITEHHPDGTSRVYDESIYTQTVNSKVLINMIPQNH
ncbi:hypothetical protein [Nocardia alni]|uniref:hypothetical protein n=1 Tax=Nocardia alni TaxID=2815723 RepID=UPI001C23C225|nr:hypothetical protein [Nocardia alni]